MRTVTYEEWLHMPEVQDATEEVVNGEIMAAVNAKVGVQGEDLARRFDLRQSNRAGIRQRHGPVAVAMHKRPQVRLLRQAALPRSFTREKGAHRQRRFRLK